MLNKKLVLAFLFFMAVASVATAQDKSVTQDKSVAQDKTASQDSDTVSVMERAAKHGDFLCYDVLVFSDRQVSQKIASQWQEQSEAISAGNSRGFWMGLLDATKGAALGALQSTSSKSFVTMGAEKLGDMLKSKKEQWRQVVTKENKFEKKLFMLENIDDFYSNVSGAGALDPSSLCFNGFGCLQKRGADTVLLITAHLDTSDAAISRILRHSKFELVLDTLVFNPKLCNLPNDSARTFSERKPYSFEERGSVGLKIDVKITSSWINQAIQIYKDVELGTFTVQTPINEASLDSDGVYRYFRARNDGKDCQIIGESFIVPRSFIGVRDSDGNYHDCWGTGQYKIAMTIKETCTITPEFEENWKADWKERQVAAKANKKSQHKPFGLISSMKQTCIQNGSTWVTTLVEAPANYTVSQVKGMFNFSAGAGGKK